MLLFALLSACAPDNEIIDGKDPGNVERPEITDPTVRDGDHDGTPDADDCAPDDVTIAPGAIELCDGIDNDCDGDVDEGFDRDDDGFWDVAACYEMDGEWDCNDDNAAVNPDEDEVCDGLDNDCDTEVDEIDEDGDGQTVCEADCDDDDPFVFDGQAEACDGVDNDCDGEVDELWDFDGDGWSECAGDCDDDDPDYSPSAREQCDTIDNDCDGLVDEDNDLDRDGMATCSGDCDDGDPTVYTGAVEVCDGVDNDCDSSTPESVDRDGDGVTICGGDCNDDSAAAFPGGSETCDGVDNDCNGYADELASCWSCTESAPYLLCDTATDWATAQNVCEGLGGGLARITSSGENTTVANLAITPTWIGANDRDVEDTWVWPDGSSVSYDDWGSGQPDDSGDADCAITNTSGRRGEWSDISCGTEYQFVCEF